MKAILLAAGEGKRMRPLTLVKPKTMIEVLGRPLIAHIIESLPSEITELVIVIGYKGDIIRQYLGDQFEGRPITYVVQEKPLGTAHALHLCKDLIAKGEKFLFILADDLHSAEALKRLVKHQNGMLVHEHADPRKFGVIEIDERNRTIGIEEKPVQPKTNLVAVGAYVFDSAFFDYKIEPSARGELEYVDVVKQMIKDGDVFVEKTDFWHPIGYPHDVDAAEQILAEKTAPLSTSVVIICGGKGTRLSESEPDVPKALVEVAGKPILAHQIEMLKRQGISDITLALGHKAEMIMDWLKINGYKDIRCAIEKQLLGTGGAVKHSAKAITSPFIAMSGDILADFNIRGLLRHAEGGHRVITGVELDDAEGMGVLECDEAKKVCSYKEKVVSGKPGLINAGLYVLYPEDLTTMPDSFSLEYDLFPKLAESGKLVLHHHRGDYWFDCGTTERLKNVRAYFANRRS